MTVTLVRPAALPVRRGARVLSDDSVLLGLGVGQVEGTAYYPGNWAFHVVRWADGSVTNEPVDSTGLVAIDGDTHLVEDRSNNVNRLCNVRGDGAAGNRVRCWLVVSAVNHGRYLVKHLDTSEMRVVDGRFGITNLY